MLEVTYCASSIDVANFQFPSAVKCKLLTAVHLRDVVRVIAKFYGDWAYCCRDFVIIHIFLVKCKIHPLFMLNIATFPKLEICKQNFVI